MAMGRNEVDRVMAIKSALVSMTATQGWRYFKQIADNVVQRAVQNAIDEDDASRGEILRRKAKAMQDGLRDLFNAVEVTKGFVAPEDDENGLGDLELDFTAIK